MAEISHRIYWTYICYSSISTPKANGLMTFLLTLILRISEYTAVYLRLLRSTLFSVGFGSATPSPVVDAPVGSVTPVNRSLCSLAWWISRSCLCLCPGGRFPASLGSTDLSQCMGPLGSRLCAVTVTLSRESV